MNDFWTQLVDYASSNELFAGLMGASLLGSVVFLLRPVPSQLLLIARRQFTVELQLDNTDEAFRWMSLWLAFQPYSRSARRLTLSTNPGYDDNLGEGRDKSWSLLPGEGVHWFWHRKRLITLKHEIDRENSRGGFIRETIVLNAVGRSQDFMRSIVEEAERLRIDKAGVIVKIYANDWWQPVGRKEPRPLESVILVEGQTDRVIADANHFFKSPDWYAKRGIPFRRGYLFSGPPGTGKTSLVLALATVMKRPVYTLNLGSLSDDDALVSAFLGVPAGAILLIEDVDVAKASSKRRRKKQTSTRISGSSIANGDGDAGITLSGLLNCIDGAVAPDGRLLVMTTNYPDKLDDALTRPGRVDLHEEFKLLDEAGGRRMCARFKADAQQTEQVIGSLKWPRSPAEIQQTLMNFK